MYTLYREIIVFINYSFAFSLFFVFVFSFFKYKVLSSEGGVVKFDGHRQQ